MFKSIVLSFVIGFSGLFILIPSASAGTVSSVSAYKV